MSTIPSTADRPRIAMVMSGFPRLSETFGLNELLALDRNRMLDTIFATKPGRDEPIHADVSLLTCPVHVLAEGSLEAQAAEVVAHLAGRNITGVHGYFAHTPAAVAALAAGALRVPYGFSTHALDARKVNADVLATRAAQASCVLACNGDVADTLRSIGAQPTMMPHGVDLGRFSPTAEPESDVLRLLAVGRLVAKKGFDVLIEAVAELRRQGVACQLNIVGDGSEGAHLRDLVAKRELGAVVRFQGVLTHEQLPQIYGTCHLVVVPSVQDINGDRDGLPNVVLEAMASGRTVIASNVAAISSAIVDGETGILVEPGNPVALATALVRVSSDSALRSRLAHNARATVVSRYDLDACLQRFVNEISVCYGC